MKKKFGFLSHLDLNLYLFRAPIMKELLKRGDEVYAICPKGDKNEKLKELGVRVVNYEIRRESINPFEERKVIDNIYNAIKDLDLDLLHTFTAKPNIYGTFAAKRAAVPIIINLVEGLGSFYLHNNIKSFIIRTIMERLYKKAFMLSDGCIFVNSDDPQYMIKKNIIPPSKVKIIKSVGVDTQKFSMQHFSVKDIENIKKQNKIEKDALVVLMVARAIWDKGVAEYYAAAEQIKQHYPKVEFIFVGETDEGNHSCASKDFLQNKNVRWLGHRDDIVALTAISDVYVLPSYREGVPVTLLEAASMSKAIVTTDTVGCKEVVENGYNGFLVQVKDSVSLANKIEVLLKDKQLREKFGNNGRKKMLEEFDVKRVVEQYMSYYEKVINV